MQIHTHTHTHTCTHTHTQDYSRSSVTAVVISLSASMKTRKLQPRHKNRHTETHFSASKRPQVFRSFKAFKEQTSVTEKRFYRSRCYSHAAEVWRRRPHFWTAPRFFIDRQGHEVSDHRHQLLKPPWFFYTIISTPVQKKKASDCGQNVEGNLRCMKHESIQQQKTASGCFLRRIMQFPWKQGERDNCSRKTLSLFLVFFFCPSFVFLRASTLKSTKPTGSQLEWSRGRRSQLPDWQTEEPPTSLAGNVSFSWLRGSEDGVPCGGVDHQDDVRPLFSNTVQKQSQSS